ncbi:hypothetical protein KBB96_08950 [Luteolibacter ambystomatis]|uniref:Uncharacterized protein n=1 Tax=Luteolibacter ambystomatis TaxID=2824561 RepID=A0A975PGW9_9BACT|nr:hypothetical protein [Luteolibacter ambystomatis]QUE53005.1 hypothetical protein KBB96_08950 [Luteolibacter ambystomatis]
MKTPVLWAALAALFLGSCKKEEEEVKPLQQSSRAPRETPRQDAQEIQRLKNRIADLEDQNTELTERLSKKSADYEKLLVSATNLTRSLRESDRLSSSQNRLSSSGTSPSQSYSSPSDSPEPERNPAPVPQPAPARVPIKWWVPENPTTAANQAKAAAMAKWKDDYAMVEYEINRQAEAYNELVDLNKTSNKAIKDIIGRAHEEWKTDYGMMLYETNRQMEALQKLQSR